MAAVARKSRLSTSERRERIAAAAQRCFAERGFAGTTSRRLARAAGVSEALIFRHFPTKKSLYRAIIERKISEPAAGFFPHRTAETGDDRDVLSSIATTLLERVEADPTFMRLLLFSALEREPLSRMFFQARVRSVREFLSAYLERRMRRGALRRMDPQTAASAFIGMIVHHLQLKHLFRIPGAARRRPELVNCWVDLFLKGLAR
ncbi:MAG: TetR/AcrR family transcriptional regulator [Planctomycetes bacterium]|nr:TetR/AcrR family transcriptional regulator [Planctomycetota bacterium]